MRNKVQNNVSVALRKGERTSDCLSTATKPPIAIFAVLFRKQESQMPSDYIVERADSEKQLYYSDIWRKHGSF